MRNLLRITKKFTFLLFRVEVFSRRNTLYCKIKNNKCNYVLRHTSADYTCGRHWRDSNFWPVKARTGLHASWEAPHLSGKKHALNAKEYEKWFPQKGTDSTAFLKVKLSSRKSRHLSLAQCSYQACRASLAAICLQQKPQQGGEHQTPSPEWLYHSHAYLTPCPGVVRTSRQGCWQHSPAGPSILHEEAVWNVLTSLPC